jgi:PAS domain S-box-containing protein
MTARPDAPLVAALGEAFDQFADAVGVFAPVRDAGGAVVDFAPVYVNPVLEGLTGLPAAAVLGHSVADEAPGLREAGTLVAWRRVLESGRVWQNEFTFRGRVGVRDLDGRFELRAVRLGDAVLCVCRDLTEIRRAEEAVERMAAIVQSTDDAVLGADGDGRITHWNAGAQRLLGWSPEEAIGRPVRTLARAEDFADQQRRYVQVLSGRAVERLETTWVRKDGSLVDVALTASPIRDREGRVFGVSAVVRDMTARKRADAELRRSHAELERFADVAAHDLREPLLAVAQLARLLGRDASGREAEIAARLTDAAAHGLRLVDGLRDLARVGRGEPAREPVDLGALAREVLVSLGPHVDEAGARVEVGPLPTVAGEGTELARVLQNLVANALKFARADGPPVVVVEAGRDDAGWVVTVRDNGPGVPEAARERIFDLFARAHADDEVEGTGLGLAVCRKVVERHGGRIWVQDAPGGGSLFRFSLPDL